MQDIHPELIEKYQILLQKDPKSKVFAPLTEAYRKLGMIEEAFRIAVRGVQYNPNFAGGRIALAKVFIDRDNLQGAVNELQKAIELSSDNILAHNLLAECYLKLKQPKEALRSYKMVLLFAPNNEKAIRAVSKLESLTADEYDDDLFEMKPLKQVEEKINEQRLKPLRPNKPSSDLERTLSLVDAFIVRNDLEKARQALKEVEGYFDNHPELIKRLKIVNQRTLGTEVEPLPDGPPLSRRMEILDRKIERLQKLLARIREKSQFT